jgi:site-specific DNA-methyltransferase (adenine-specific)
MAVAIEDAGFQIRDQIMWVYGSGFPKSHNISKAIDKIEGVEPTVVGQRLAQGSARKIKGTNAAANKIPNSGSLEYDETIIYETVATSDAAQQWDGWGTALKPAHEPMVLARKPLEGTVANNVLTYGVGGLNIDGSRVATDDVFGGGAKGTSGFAAGYDADGWVAGSDKGRFPANFIHDGSDEVVALFPDTKSGDIKKGTYSHSKIRNVAFGEYGARPDAQHTGDSGSAARFFYCAKASKRDRNDGLDGFEEKEKRYMATANGTGKTSKGMEAFTSLPSANHHPTVKPTALMQYLVRLVTPPNGIVLDPFMGSGSTGKACAYEGFDFIGIDQSAEYVAIAQARIDFALGDKSDELPL